MDERIVVVAGNIEQARYWIRQNIILVTNKVHIRNLQGIKIKEVYYEGTPYEWLDAEADAELHALLIRNRCRKGE